MRQITLTLDDVDYDAIQKATGCRQAFRVMPDGEGCLMGRTIAEICRGWLEFINRGPEDDDPADWWKTHT